MESLKSFIQELIAAWNQSRTPRLAAALAFYSLFSLAPMLFIALTVVSIFFRDLQPAGRVIEQLEAILGTETVELLLTAVYSLAGRSTSGSAINTIISLGALLYAATGLFAQLKDSLNTIWGIPFSETSGIKQIIKGRLLAFILVLGAGLLFVMATFANIAVSFIASLFRFESSLNLVNNLFILVLAVLAIAMLYKILPDTHVAWKDVWFGAAISAGVILIGSRLMGLYLSNSNMGSAFEAAGALAVLLVGVYYLTQIFLFGAVFTRVYARTYGSLRPLSEISPSIVDR